MYVLTVYTNSMVVNKGHLSEPMSCMASLSVAQALPDIKQIGMGTSSKA